MEKSYDEWWNFTKTPNFDIALGGLRFAADMIIRRLFYDRTRQNSNSLMLCRRNNHQIANIEKAYQEALVKYEKKYEEPFSFNNWYDLAEAFNFYEGEDENEPLPDHESIQTLMVFVAVKEIFDFVKSYDSMQIEDKFSRFQDIAALILNVYTNIVALSEREDEKLIFRELITENARKAAKTRRSPYEKAGTIAAVNELLEENQEILKKKGGKTTLYKLIRDLIASGDIPAPKEPTEKTIFQWITNFEDMKSAS